MLAAVEAAEAQVEAGVKDATDLLAESMTARGKQANLSFFAFTATPKPKTLELFGQQVTGPDGAQRCRAVPPVLDAPGHRRGVHPRRAGQLHDLRHVLPAGEHRADRRPGGADREGVLGAGPVRVAAPDEPGAEGRGHRRALPRQDRRARSAGTPRRWW